jgi:hypothetical protein
MGGAEGAARFFLMPPLVWRRAQGDQMSNIFNMLPEARHDVLVFGPTHRGQVVRPASSVLD